MKESAMEQCGHPRITGHLGRWSCSDCGAERPYPGGCSHPRIDNDTYQCIDCGEKMIGRTENVETILSAPNAAPCTDPRHLAAIAAGEDFECNHPYVPDRSREQVIPIAVHVRYQCERCRYNGTIFSGRAETIWDCGHDHRGASIPEPARR